MKLNLKGQNANKNFDKNLQEKNTLKTVSNENNDKKTFKGLNSFEGLINSEKFDIEREKNDRSQIKVENKEKKTGDHTNQHNKNNSDNKKNDNSNNSLDAPGQKKEDFTETTNILSINKDIKDQDQKNINDIGLNKIIKKLSELNQIKQVVIEKMKKEETTQVKFKSDHHENNNTKTENDRKLLNPKKEDVNDVDKLEPKLDIDTSDVIYLDQNRKNTFNKQLNYQGKANGTADPSSLIGNFKKISEKYEQKDSKKQTVLKRNPKGIKNKYFYRIKSQLEFFKIGMSYYKELLNGNKSLAFITKESFLHQKNTILAIASFIKYQENIKILVASFDLQNGQYKNVVQKSINDQTLIGNNDDEIPIFYEHEGITFVDYKEIFNFRDRYDENSYSELINLLTHSFDLILWDVPTLSELKSRKEDYFPIFISFDKVSLIIKKAKDNYKSVNDMKMFFNRYGINIKGILFGPTL